MKCTIPEISWHNREPVLSVDISPISNDFYKVATGGGDSHVLIWQMDLTDKGAIKQEIISDLTRHQKAVNVVRWSPTGEYLASADDDANVIIWRMKTDNIPLLEGDSGDKEVWVICKILRGHKEDIYDICWSVNGLKVFSGSIDNTAILWDLSRGKMEHILSDHKGFVQGVAWDPKDQVIVTISTDRICRIFDISGKQIKARIHKGRLPVSSDHYLYEKNVKYFHDDTFKSFFRRLQFSPDGTLLIVPSGHMETEDCKKILNATLIFTMDNNCTEPVAILPLPKQCSTVVRCCPVLFELREDGPEAIINLPYRMIIAIGTDHDVILYDTQQLVPFARFQEVHYTRLTDLTWSNDGLFLIASSTDGFCSLITFDITELGVPYVKYDSEMEDNPIDVSGCEELLNTDENIDINNKNTYERKYTNNIHIETKKRPSFLEEWALKTPKKLKLDITNDDNELNEFPKEIKEEINTLIPRRTSQQMEIIPNKTDTVVKPIEVNDGADLKELPKEIKEEINRLIPRRASHQLEIISNKIDSGIAKPIEVRRKPKEKGRFIKHPIPPAEIESYYVEQINDVETSTGIQNIKSNKSLISTNDVDKSSESIYCQSSKNEDLSKKINSSNCKVIEGNLCIKGSDKTVRNEPIDSVRPIAGIKKENPSIKVSSLIKKKKSSSPIYKRNPLLTFLQSSEEKCESSKKTKINSITSSNVDLTINDEAQDAWKCESNKNNNIKKDESANATQIEEDCTEDFCLQLEESESEKKNYETTEDREAVNKKPLNNPNKIGKAASEVIIDISDDSNDCDKVVARNSPEKKIPRRVALITLSSPKGKKKEKP